MKKVTLLCSMLLAMSATLASAGGVNLAWTNCVADGGTQNRNFACTSNLGSNVLSGSFVLDADLANASGLEIIVDVTTASASLPKWWEFKNVGSCRINASSISNYPDGANCFDWSAGQATPAIAAYQVGLGGANRARFNAISAVGATALAQLVGGVEYGAFKISISNSGTVGTTCTGCSTAACIVFNSLNVTTSGNLNNTKLTTEATPGGNFATWQGGTGTNCPAATPTRNATWGSVKSMYR